MRKQTELAQVEERRTLHERVLLRKQPSPRGFSLQMNEQRARRASNQLELPERAPSLLHAERFTGLLQMKLRVEVVRRPHAVKRLHEFVSKFLDFTAVLGANVQGVGRERLVGEMGGVQNGVDQSAARMEGRIR